MSLFVFIGVVIILVVMFKFFISSNNEYGIISSSKDGQTGYYYKEETTETVSDECAVENSTELLAAEESTESSIEGIEEDTEDDSVFEEFSDGMRLMAHNAKFDMGFLDTYMRKNLGKAAPTNTLDTLAMSRAIVKDVPNHKLGTLATHFNIDYSGAHRSLRDCEITLEVYNNIRKIYEGR